MGNPSEAEEPIASLARRAGEQLRRWGLTLAVAESCTGGALGDAITDIAGSSDYFLGGIIAYANRAKETLLGVPRTVLESVGAVSPETATAMAEGARRQLGSELALASTGIAGPGGATPGKPVGLVYVALATPEASKWRCYTFGGSRRENKQATVRAALEMLADHLAACAGAALTTTER